MASDTAMNDRAVERHDAQLAEEQQCSSCKGSGDCQMCGGWGYVLDMGRVTCDRCHGSGDCRRCEGGRDRAVSGAALFTMGGHLDRLGTFWEIGSEAEADPLLSRHHYLGPIGSGGSELVIVGSIAGVVVAAQVWRRPTARNLPADGSWLELSRWCLTPDAGANAGSRQHRYALRIIRDTLPDVTTLVSYSDPSHGHTGALYRSCNWIWAPTWHRLRTPPTGNGSWDGGVTAQAVKDRWIYPVKKDARRADVVHIDDSAAIRSWLATATDYERRWAQTNDQLRGAA